jgi:tRNA/rRNA methyltransferase
MWNMGVSRLTVVEPLRWDREAMTRLATRRAAHLIHALEVYQTLEAALRSFQFVVGTSAREGGFRDVFWTPRKAAGQVLSLAGENRVALLFGPEDRGLSNHELRLCHALVRIPTAQFASLNVAHSVMVLCYELHSASLAPAKGSKPAALATMEDLEQMYSHLQGTLTKISLIHPRHVDHGMMKVRQSLSRVGLRVSEVQLIRGLCRQIEWYGRSREEEALKRAEAERRGIEPSQQ